VGFVFNKIRGPCGRKREEEEEEEEEELQCFVGHAKCMDNDWKTYTKVLG
jgi:hypothetical protein